MKKTASAPDSGAKRGAAAQGIVALGAGAALAIAGLGIAGAQATGLASEADGADAGQQTAGMQATEQAAQTGVVERDSVEGEFSFTQGEVSSNDWIVRHIAEASAYTCNSGSGTAGDQEAASVEDWGISVSGDVSQPYEATVGELAQTDEMQHMVMGCSCAGNPTDGTSIANALVGGIPATTLVNMAQPVEGANTVVFVSADGYEVALPLSYIESHYCPIVFDVNGSPLAASVGGTNQLWLGSTPASYFARDVVSIRVETRDEAPSSPTSEEARAELGTLPNVGVLFGGAVE